MPLSYYQDSGFLYNLLIYLNPRYSNRNLETWALPLLYYFILITLCPNILKQNYMYFTKEN